MTPPECPACARCRGDVRTLDRRSWNSTVALTINTNLDSLNAQRQLGSTQGGLATSIQRLSSGLRINSASDRQAIQSEVSHLAAEIERSSDTAQFNRARLFDPSRASAIGDETQLAVFNGLTSVGSWLENSEVLIQNLYGLKSDGAALQIKYTVFTDNAGGVAA